MFSDKLSNAPYGAMPADGGVELHDPVCTVCAKEVAVEAPPDPWALRAGAGVLLCFLGFTREKTTARLALSMTILEGSRNFALRIGCRLWACPI